MSNENKGLLIDGDTVNKALESIGLLRLTLLIQIVPLPIYLKMSIIVSKSNLILI